MDGETRGCQMNWRKLEIEIVDIVEQMGYDIQDYNQADKYMSIDGNETVNLTAFAKELADRLERLAP